ncbi:MAG TPA: hypothetical protein VGE25_02030 [Sediminibacterium sp.]
MAKTIDVTENGSNRRLSILISNILYVESLTYNSGTTVTIITLVGDKQLHVNENVVNVKGQINAE